MVNRKSTVEKAETGRLVLTVYYDGDEYDQAMQKRIKKHRLSNCNAMTVIALPGGMDDWAGT